MQALLGLSLPPLTKPHKADPGLAEARDIALALGAADVVERNEQATR